jgi:hypothetical protein
MSSTLRNQAGFAPIKYIAVAEFTDAIYTYNATSRAVELLSVSAANAAARRILYATGRVLRPETHGVATPMVGVYFFGASNTSTVYNGFIDPHLSTRFAPYSNDVRETPIATDWYTAGTNTNADISASTITATGNLTVSAGGNLSVAMARGIVSAINQPTGIYVGSIVTLSASDVAVMTISNSLVTATSRVFVSLTNATNTAGRPVVQAVTPTPGMISVAIHNSHPSAAVNGTLSVSFVVLN